LQIAKQLERERQQAAKRGLRTRKVQSKTESGRQPRRYSKLLKVNRFSVFGVVQEEQSLEQSLILTKTLVRADPAGRARAGKTLVSKGLPEACPP
jgi:hypothetical protein